MNKIFFSKTYIKAISLIIIFIFFFNINSFKLKTDVQAQEPITTGITIGFVELTLIFTSIGIYYLAIQNNKSAAIAVNEALDWIREKNIKLVNIVRQKIEIIKEKYLTNPSTVTRKFFNNPVMIGMNLAFAELLLKYGFNINDYNDPESIVDDIDILMEDSSFTKEFTELMAAYENIFGMAGAQAFSLTLISQLVSIMESFGDCLKDPNAWKYLAAGLGFVGWPISFIMLTISLLKIGLNMYVISILGALTLSNAIWRDITSNSGPFSNAKKAFNKISECLESHEFSADHKLINDGYIHLLWIISNLAGSYLISEVYP